MVLSQLHELLAPLYDGEFLVVEERAAQLLALLLGGPAGDRREGDLHGRALPEVLVVGFDHRDVLAAQAVLQGAQRLALVLQAGGKRQLEFEPNSAEQGPEVTSVPLRSRRTPGRRPP